MADQGSCPMRHPAQTNAPLTIEYGIALSFERGKQGWRRRGDEANPARTARVTTTVTHHRLGDTFTGIEPDGGISGRLCVLKRKRAGEVEVMADVGRGEG